MSCPHVESLDFSFVKKKLSSEKLHKRLTNGSLTCQVKRCGAQHPDLWACLAPSCMFVGCGRQKAKHALEHGADDAHPVCVHLASKMVWCYACDRELTAYDEDLTDAQCSLLAACLESDKKRRKVAIKEALRVATEKSAKSKGSGDTDAWEESGVAARAGVGDAAAEAETFTRTPFDEVFPPHRQQGRTGLSNLGNTCFMNAALQVLSNCGPLTEHFLRWHSIIMGAQVPSSPAKNRIVHEYVRLLASMWQGKARSVSPKGVLRASMEINSMFRGYAQQDSQEFLSFFIDALHEALKIEVSDELFRQRMQDKFFHTHTDPSKLPPDSDDVKDDMRKKYSSIISHVFEGIMLSEVQCLHCNHVSYTEDHFYSIPLSIPGKKDRARLDASASTPTPTRTHTPSTTTSTTSSSASSSDDDDAAGGGVGNGSGGGSSAGGGGWLSGLAGLVGLGGGKATSILECIDLFCASETLTGSERYRCEKCKERRDSTKTMSMLRLPEVMVLLIKRFRYDVMFGRKINTAVDIPADVDFGAYVHASSRYANPSTKYKLIGIVNHHGTMGGGHYTAYARNFCTDSWHHFDDSRVKGATCSEAQGSQAYIVVYQRKRSKRIEQASRRVQKLITATATTPPRRMCYLSAMWYDRMLTLSNPGALAMPMGLMCVHGRVRDPPPALRADVMHVSEDVWHMLHERYGGGPLVYATGGACALCEEQSEVNRLDGTSIGADSHWRLIDSGWIRLWRLYVTGRSPNHPGPISNEHLLTEEGYPRRGLVRVKHFRGINEHVWGYLVGIYGGGPPILRSTIDIYADPPEGSY